MIEIILNNRNNNSHKNLDSSNNLISLLLRGLKFQFR